MMTREELREAARALGKASAEVGDTYDVIMEFSAGYAKANADLFRDVPKAERVIHYQLSTLNELQSVAREVIQWTVDDARQAHMSWGNVAEALDLTRESARRKYGTAEDQI